MEAHPGNSDIHQALILSEHVMAAIKQGPSRDAVKSPISSSESEGEVEVVGDSKIEVPALPPVAALFRPPLEVGKVYVVKNVGRARNSWGLAKLVTVFYNVHKGVTKNRCVVQYCNGRLAPRHLELYEMAYLDVWPTQIPLGTAVVTNSKSDKSTICYPGIVLEVPNPLNDFRYLVFFDDGNIGYRQHKDVKVICDVYQGNTSIIDRHFVRGCLNIHPDRLVLKFKLGEIVTVGRKGEWMEGTVKKIDCSIILLEFDDGSSKWYYRGSYKFKTILKGELPKSFKRYPHLHLTSLSTFRRKVNAIMDSKSQEGNAVELDNSRSSSIVPVMNASPSPFRSKIIPQGDVSNLSVVTPRLIYFPRNLGAHLCSERCVGTKEDVKRIDPQSGPLLRPLLLGFKRFSTGHCIKYKTPCGRTVSNFRELSNYLNQTQLTFSLENFDFSTSIDVQRIYLSTPGTALVTINDISNNLEEGGLPCINEVDNSTPEPITYMNERKMLNGDDVINTGGDFVSCCSCDDNCMDSSKCECIQLTHRSYLELHEETPLTPQEMSYQHKRLFKEVRSGIYECNNKCKCNPQCPNRVAQFPLRAKLQVFHTGKKGWGVRTLYDLPKGSFVCTYIGKILNEEEANDWGVLHGDDYLTDLDFVEKQESLKPGFEDRVLSTDTEKEERENSRQSEAIKTGAEKYSNTQRRISKRKLRTKDTLHQFFSSIKKRKRDRKPTGKAHHIVTGSIKNFYPADHGEFTVDAKLHGNIGRYINHACEPNMFVQNVFVDTHDLRLPWVAFFALNDIKAGTELTWDYNYRLGSVKGRRLYCFCLATICKGRLY